MIIRFTTHVPQHLRSLLKEDVKLQAGDYSPPLHTPRAGWGLKVLGPRGSGVEGSGGLRV